MKIAIHSNLDYTVSQPCDLLLQVGVAPYAGQTLSTEALVIKGDPKLNNISGEDGVGQRAWLTITDRFVCDYKVEIVIDRDKPDFHHLQRVPLTAMGEDVVRYLMPSRYCFPEDFFDVTSTTFAGLSGGARVAAMADWIGENFSYDPFASHMQMTATDSFAARSGVCRDYAHTLIAMCRAVGIPARIVSAYAPFVTPQDFHAVVEVYLDGGWHLIDPTGMATADQIAVMGVGRDAADISFMTSYGLVEMKKQTVTVSVQ